MKTRFLLTSTLIAAVFTFNQAKATEGSTGSTAGTVTLNVKLNPIQTLTVNPAQDHKIVDLVYNTADDYKNGVSVTKNNHLSVYSTGGFQIKVKSAGSELTRSSQGGNAQGSDPGNIQANSIKIAAKAGSDAIQGAAYTDQSLSATEATIITSTTGGVNKNFDITYQGAGADAYLNNYRAGQNPTVYTTTVTYTIIAQ